MKAAAIAVVLAALHPQAVQTKPTPSECGQIVKLVAMFGIDRVVDEARRRGMSEQTISRIRRRCELE